MKSKEVIIIGSGISGLMCAFKLLNAGYNVEIISKSPEFNYVGEKKEYYSSTLNGKAGRFFTAFEGHPYIGNSSMYPDMKDAFKTKVSKGGWLGKDIALYNKDEKRWLEKRWKSNENNLNFSEKFDNYVNSNLHSMSKWREMSKNHPDIFNGTDFYDGKILRLYNHPKQLKYAIELHRKYDVLKTILDVSAIAKKHPIYRESSYNGFFSGGIEVIGQTINIIKLSYNLIYYLKSKGVKFHFDTEVLKIHFNKFKDVASISTENKNFKCTNYVFCTGAYHRKKLFYNTKSKNAFGGIAGKWFLIPKPNLFSLPTKIHVQLTKATGEFYPVIDFNLTPYYDEVEERNFVAIGGGYVYSGNFPFTGNDRELRFTDEINKEALKNSLGSLYKKLFDDGELIFSSAICYRSFSYDDNPKFDSQPTDFGGKLIITGGTNTGTATIAPYISERVLEIIEKAPNNTL